MAKTHEGQESWRLTSGYKGPIRESNRGLVLPRSLSEIRFLKFAFLLSAVL